MGKTQALRARRVAAIAAMTGALVAAVPAAAADGPYIVSGSCRDGVPNGAYELRMQDGRLRVSGALARGRRTGTFIFWAPSGARVAVIPYDDNAKIGTVALWYPPASPGGEPRRRQESAYSGGALHGITRSWHANGKPRSEYRYEQGALAEARAWSDAGRALAADAARALAQRDRDADAAEYAGLERLIAEHAPQCE